MDQDKFHKFGLAVYGVIFLLAIITALVGVFIFKDGSIYNICLNLSAGLLESALVFFLVQRLFLFNPNDQSQKVISDQLKQVSLILEKVTA
jgi:hypothetical protein